MATITLRLISSRADDDKAHETYYPDADEAIDRGYELAHTLATLHKDAVWNQSGTNYEWKLIEGDTIHMTTIHISRQLAYIITIEK